MKYFILVSLLVNTLFATNDKSTQIAHQLSLLEKELHNNSYQIPKIIYDPFYPKGKEHLRISKSTNKSKKKGTNRRYLPALTMILNKKAFIGGKWYKENEKIADYIVYKISEDTVFLKKRNKIVKLKISPLKSILTAKEE